MATKPRILLIDDNEVFLRQFYPLLVAGQDYEVTPLTSIKKALELLDDKPVDLIISDIHMSEMNGTEFFKKVQEQWPDTPVIFITAYGSMQQAIQLVKQGAFHYFEKPIIDKMDLFQTTIREGLVKRKMQKELASLLKEKALLAGRPVTIIGESEEIKKVLGSIHEVASIPITVLLSGETGTGKDVVARAIHALSDRRDDGFFHINCGEFADGVLESELFGHERGSFTGAFDRRRGIFEVSDQGTLFLDEISEASQRLQTKLLRILETKTFTRVGSSSSLQSDFRLIAATNRNLDEEVAAGRFRQDLLYRLNVYTIRIPPLRKRKDDIPLLAEFYLNKFKQTYHRPIEGISDEALLFLREYAWPGNVRELVNVMERAVITCPGNLITLKQLPFQSDEKDPPRLSDLNLKDAEKFLISMALRRSGGNKLKAAELLGINRKTLVEKIKSYGWYETAES